MTISSPAEPVLSALTLSIYMLQKHPEDRVVCLDKLTYAGNLETLAEAMKNPQFPLCASGHLRPRGRGQAF